MAVTGGFCPLPHRLGGTAETGMTAEQHARAAADMVAVKRTARFCVFRWDVSGGGVLTLSDYRGMNGAGSVYAPDVLAWNAGGSNAAAIGWSTMRFSDSYQIAAPFLPRHAVVQATATSYARAVWALVPTGIFIRVFDDAGSNIAPPLSGTCELW